jgi:hypothetical protein
MIKNTKLRSKGVKRARKLIYTAECQASYDIGLIGLRLKPGLLYYPLPPKKLVLKRLKAGLLLFK